jgi:hypothetical protein
MFQSISIHASFDQAVAAKKIPAKVFDMSDAVKNPCFTDKDLKDLRSTNPQCPGIGSLGKSSA